MPARWCSAISSPCQNGIDTGLREFARESGIAVLLQAAGPDSICCLEPESLELGFEIPAFGLNLVFEPTDFIQINVHMNRMMIDRVVDLLDLSDSDRVLDLFCGLGNFSLPIATRAASVTGVEGDAGLVSKAGENAARNRLQNVQFHCADLNEDPGTTSWLRQAYHKVLVDPPRSVRRIHLASYRCQRRHPPCVCVLSSGQPGA